MLQTHTIIYLLIIRQKHLSGSLFKSLFFVAYKSVIIILARM